MDSILVIDDEAPFRGVLTTALRARGHVALEAANCREGILAATNHAPDLIICDVEMPDGTGHDVFEVLKQRSGTSAIPFIFMTGRNDPNELRRSMEQGADDFLSKPFPMESLLAAVEARLRRGAMRRSRAEQTEKRLQAIVEANPDLVAMANVNTRQILYLNRAGRQLLGLGAREDAAALGLGDIHPPGVMARVAGEIIPAALENGSWSGESTLLTRSRAEVRVFQVVVAHKSNDGQVEFLSINAHDLTERKRAEELNIRLAMAVEQAFETIVITDTQGAILYANPAFEKSSGCTRAEAVGRNARLLDNGQQEPGFYSQVWECLRRGEIWRGHLVNRRKDGAIYEEEATISPVRDATGNPINFVAVKRDVTREMQLQAQFRQSQKLEAIGQLAAGIAHEINTPTQFIGDNLRFIQDVFNDLLGLSGQINQLLAAARGQSFAQSLTREIEKTTQSINLADLEKEIPKAITQALSGVQRVAKIVQAMKEFSHPGTEAKVPIDLNRAIESTLTVCRNEWKYVAVLQTDFDPSLPPVSCLPGEFNQVILNIIVNAAHAIADKELGKGMGAIGVSTRQQRGGVEIRISDTGTGIPAAVRGRIFDPFFTTKEVGKGTGQGLAIARSVIVDKHRGEISFETQAGLGTTFVIWLPGVEKRNERETPPA